MASSVAPRRPPVAFAGPSESQKKSTSLDAAAPVACNLTSCLRERCERRRRRRNVVAHGRPAAHGLLPQPAAAPAAGARPLHPAHHASTGSEEYEPNAEREGRPQACLRAPSGLALRKPALPRQCPVRPCRHAHAAAAAERGAGKPKGKQKGKDAGAPAPCVLGRAAARRARRNALRAAPQATRRTRTPSTCPRPASACAPTPRSASPSCSASGRPTACTRACWRATRGCAPTARARRAAVATPRPPRPPDARAPGRPGALHAARRAAVR